MLCIPAPPSISDRRVTAQDCIVLWYERIRYSQALDLQMRICESKKNGFDTDVLLLLEHPPVITMGRSGNLKNLLIDENELKARGIEFWNIDRGGDITFHGPGQLVGYPILSLKPGERDVRRYMRNLEESLIRLLALFDIEGFRDKKFTGVWTKEGKIGAMGVHISRWITRHGFALNVNTDLSHYNLIVPCGIVGKSVTSMKKVLSQQVEMREVVDHYIKEFGVVFNRRMIGMSEQSLIGELERHSGKTGLNACASPDAGVE
jgi:lipoate-protein ligase B